MKVIKITHRSLVWRQRKAWLGRILLVGYVDRITRPVLKGRRTWIATTVVDGVTSVHRSEDAARRAVRKRVFM